MKKPDKERFTMSIYVDIMNKLRKIGMEKNKSTTQIIVDILKEKLKIKEIS